MRMQRITGRIATLAALLVAVGACRKDAKPGAGDEQAKAAPARNPNAVEVAYDPAEKAPTDEQLAAMRRDASWMEVVQLDTTGSGRAIRFNERWEQISADAVNRGGITLPISGDVAGPSVLRVQVLLDRAYFSPGMMDGNWGKNTAEALYWFQRDNGLPATARADSATVARLLQAAGSPRELVAAHRLTAQDVAGPFTPIPTDIYEHAKLGCSCYEALSEKLSEMFHTTPALLQKLNPGVDLEHARAGQTIHGPAVRATNAPPRGRIATIEVSGRGTYVHAVDAAGRVLYHFPSTLGATYSPSPSGHFAIASVTQNPVWHYQPALLTGVDDSLPEATIPKGPNNAVGVVWMALSAPHYGIHGTSTPQTIGYATSHGCIRLTNWDAEFLSHQVHAGIPVRFRDIAGAGGGTAPSNDGSADQRRDSSTLRSHAPSASGRGEGAAAVARSTQPAPARRRPPTPALPARTDSTQTAAPDSAR
ncbi:MAG: peptidoglycan-binding protein [Gemmatimonadetes bacterium]|nr:peptidoglycan-binding protein [Gemmatimonadota bacterium]